MAYYTTSGLYIQSKTTLKARIAAIDAIIDALMLMAAESPSSANYSEYYLDDGQTRITTKYRSVMDVQQGIAAFEKIKNKYVNQLNGRVRTLVDIKNIRPHG